MNHKMKKSVMDSTVMDARRDILEAMLKSPVAKDELLRNLGLYLLPM